MKTENKVARDAAKEDDQQPLTVVAASAMQVANAVQVARFRGRPMVLEHLPYPHFVPMHKDKFESLAYPLLGGISRSRLGDVFAYLTNTAQDLTDYDDLVLFGAQPEELAVEATTDLAYLHKNKPRVWNMTELMWEPGGNPDLCIWRSPHAPLKTQEEKGSERIPFIMQLAGGDPGLYDDIMQSIAPIVMTKKPDGVIWWIGDGANGKSTLMDAIWRVFPGQLSSLTVKRLVDGRDTPSLNGTLANVVKESSEGRVDDTEVYKSIGTHENFRVHRFHSQDDMEIRGNLHHIFSGNSVPIFNDKGYSTRRRTFIIPFTQRFESDPGFEARTFTQEFFGRFIVEICKYARQIERQGFRYKWSAQTLAAKLDYDTDANNAEEYAKHIIQEGVVAFESFHPVKMDYENWCADNGYVPLGITNLRRAMSALNFDRVTTWEGKEASRKIYRLAVAKTAQLQPLGLGRPGLFTMPGFQPEPTQEEKTAVPEFKQPVSENGNSDTPPEVEAKPKSVLNGKW